MEHDSESDAVGDNASGAGEPSAGPRQGGVGPAGPASDRLVDALTAVLERGRSLLDLPTGRVVRTVDGSGRVVAATGDAEAGARAALPDDLLRETVGADGAVAAVADGDAPAATADERGRPGYYLGHRVTVNDEPFGAVCFTAPEPPAAGPDETERALVELLARLAGAELARDRPNQDVGTGQVFNETLLDTVPDVLYAFTDSGQIVQWNDRLEAVTGYDATEIATMDPLEFVAEADRERLATAVGNMEGSDVASVEADLLTADGERIPYQFQASPITDGDGETLGFAGAGRDVSAYEEHRETLTALHDATRGLLRVDTEEAVCETVVATLADVLDIAVSAAYLFDEADNCLRPVAQTDDAADVVGEPPSFGPGEGVAWRVFMRGDAAVFDDVREADDVYNPDTPVRSELCVPLGEHGVLLAGTTEVGSFDDRTVELANLLAATAEAALDNVARRRALDDRDERLERQHRQLRRLDEVNERVRRIGHALVSADDRETIESLVCERVAETEFVSFAWIGERDADGSVTVRTWAGTDPGYLDATLDAGAAGSTAGPESEPVVTALDAREPVVVDRLAEGFRSDGWRREALTRDFRAAAAFPLVDGRVPRGVLGVYADRADAFDDETRRVFTDLADMVADAVGRVERRRAREAGDAVELTVRVRGGTSAVFAFADAVGAELTVESAVPESGGRCLLYGETPADADAVENAFEATTGIEAGRVLAADGPVRFEATTGDRTAADVTREFDGRFERAEFDGDGARVVVRLPATVDTRAFLSALETAGTGVEVLAKRTGPDDRPTVTDPLDGLTGRQREALLAAYHAGFFEWPRESAGEEVAADLGVAQPTFVEHLRRAQASLLDTLLDEE